MITSGGGFSTFFKQPSWQLHAVHSYFSKFSSSNSPSPGYNSHGRGYPDISLLGVNYEAIVGGSSVQLYGTSASTPVLAALVTLLNSYRLAQNKSTIGFMNPTLYANISSSKFNDVRLGSNKCCSNPPTGNSPTCCLSGFQATAGWDPVTGMGSINFDNFASIFDTNATRYVALNLSSSSDLLNLFGLGGLISQMLYASFGLIFIILVILIFICNQSSKLTEVDLTSRQLRLDQPKVELEERPSLRESNLSPMSMESPKFHSSGGIFFNQNVSDERLLTTVGEAGLL